jgi:hypothetical protein
VALARRAGVVLALTAVGLSLFLARLVVVAALDPDGSRLGLYLVGVPLLAATAFAVPRLITVCRTALTFRGVGAMPPALRRDAAHPLVAWPVQLTGYGALAAAVVVTPATTLFALGLVTGVTVAALVTWRPARARHARLATDVIVPGRVRTVRAPLWTPARAVNRVPY